MNEQPHSILEAAAYCRGRFGSTASAYQEGREWRLLIHGRLYVGEDFAALVMSAQGERCCVFCAGETTAQTVVGLVCETCRDMAYAVVDAERGDARDFAHRLDHAMDGELVSGIEAECPYCDGAGSCAEHRRRHGLRVVGTRRCPICEGSGTHAKEGA